MDLEDKLNKCSIKQLEEILKKMNEELEKIKLENKKKELLLEDTTF